MSQDIALDPVALDPDPNPFVVVSPFPPLMLSHVPRVDPRHLYGLGSPARALYERQFCADRAARTPPGTGTPGAPHSAIPSTPPGPAHLSPRSPATDPGILHACGAPQSILFLGAGPVPSSEIGLLEALISAAAREGREPLAHVIAHDIDDGSASNTAHVIRRESYPASRIRWSCDSTPLHLRAPSVGVDLATMLGYTHSNLLASERAILLGSLRARRLLVDVPLGDLARDPRAVGTLTLAESDWLQAAVFSHLPAARVVGAPPRLHFAVHGRGSATDYTVSCSVDGPRDPERAVWCPPVKRAHDPSPAGARHLVLAWQRRSLAGWIDEFAAAGWRALSVAASHDAAHPLGRAALLLERA